MKIGLPAIDGLGNTVREVIGSSMSATSVVNPQSPPVSLASTVEANASVVSNRNAIHRLHPASNGQRNVHGPHWWDWRTTWRVCGSVVYFVLLYSSTLSIQ